MKIGLIGNQNSGKTTLFNLLTGSNQKVGNWPGVTIEQKIGTIKGTSFQLIDLPGIYSLSPYTKEEEISRNFIINDLPDLIINIVDATSIERSLYLTTQLMELDCQVIIALNMIDMLERKKITLDINQLQLSLGIPVIPISAKKNTGIEQLIETIANLNYAAKPNNVVYNINYEELIAKITAQLNCSHKRFVAIKILEGDIFFTKIINQEIKKIIKNTNELEIEEEIASCRYQYISLIKKQFYCKNVTRETITDRIDKFILNKWLALPIFILIMFSVYLLSVGIIGSYTVNLVENFFNLVGDWLTAMMSVRGVSNWLISLVVDGIIAGVGAVLAFVPQLIILFLCISLLETSGYMSRIAFFLDKIFRKFGLSGKTLIPFIVGMGCSVPGIMTTRTIENEEERKMSIILTPFIPCSAKLPIITSFAGVFFGRYGAIVSVSLYFLAIIIIIFTALILKKFIYRNQDNVFISELPEYKIPSPKYVCRDVGDKTLAFIKRAGSIILLSSIVIWFLLSFSWKLKYGEPIQNSLLASIGRLFSWVFYPILGEYDNWGATVSAIQGLIAKEQVISSMKIIAGLDGNATNFATIFEPGQAFSYFTPASAYAFMVFNLFSAPCIGAIGAMRRELGSTKRMFGAIILQTGFAWVLAVIIFGFTKLLGVIF